MVFNDMSHMSDIVSIMVFNDICHICQYGVISALHNVKYIRIFY